MAALLIRPGAADSLAPESRNERRSDLLSEERGGFFVQIENRVRMRAQDGGRAGGGDPTSSSCRTATTRSQATGTSMRCSSRRPHATPRRCLHALRGGRTPGGRRDCSVATIRSSSETWTRAAMDLTSEYRNTIGGMQPNAAELHMQRPLKSKSLTHCLFIAPARLIAFSKSFSDNLPADEHSAYFSLGLLCTTGIFW